MGKEIPKVFVSKRYVEDVRKQLSKEIDDEMVKYLRQTRDWEYWDFVRDLHHEAHRENLDDDKILLSLRMMIDKQYEILFNKDK